MEKNLGEPEEQREGELVKEEVRGGGEEKLQKLFCPPSYRSGFEKLGKMAKNCAVAKAQPKREIDFLLEGIDFYTSINGKELNKSTNPDEAIACCAAVQVEIYKFIGSHMNAMEQNICNDAG